MPVSSGGYVRLPLPKIAFDTGVVTVKMLPF
jgi:hypothetical protein